MTSKTKALKKGTYTLGNATPAPANKAEKTVSNNHPARDKRKEAEARSRARRIRSIMKLGLSPEQIEELFTKENNRMVLVLLSGQYTKEAGTKQKKIYKHGKLVNTEEVPNILRGYEAAKAYVDECKLEFVSGHGNAIWLKSDAEHVDAVVEQIKILGRVSVTKPEPTTYDSVKSKLDKEKKTDKKPTNNTTEVKKAAKAKRKADNISRHEMRPYYAALRKGAISARIKKHNPKLAEKIEKWLKDIKDAKKVEAARAEKSKEYRAKHRQLTSLERKANKKARKAVKHLAAIERRKIAEKVAMERNAAAREKAVQKAQKPVQTELKMAA